MKTSSLEILEKSELPTGQAHAILKVLEQEMASSQESLATRADVTELRLATQADLTGLRRATQADLAELRRATQADLTELRLETKADINGMGSKLAWMVLTCFMTQLGIMVAGMALIYSHVGK